jgi:SH3-like domain-containing protein
MKKIFLNAKVLTLFFLFGVYDSVLAQEKYFVYTKFQVVNLRVGPGKTHPISWEIKYKGEPLEVYHTIENWLKCVDYNGDEGWVHSSNVSKRNPSVVIRTLGSKYVIFYARDDESSRRLFKVENGRRVKLKKCNEKWCKVAANNQSAWVLREFVWGVN